MHQCLPALHGLDPRNVPTSFSSSIDEAQLAAWCKWNGLPGLKGDRKGSERQYMQCDPASTRQVIQGFTHCYTGARSKPSAGAGTTLVLGCLIWHHNGEQASPRLQQQQVYEAAPRQGCSMLTTMKEATHPQTGCTMLSAMPSRQP